MPVVLYHPLLDRTHTVPTERTAAVYRLSGWVDADTEADDLDQYHTGGGWYEVAGERVRGKDAARAALAEVEVTDVGGDESPEPETPDTQEE